MSCIINGKTLQISLILLLVLICALSLSACGKVKPEIKEAPAESVKPAEFMTPSQPAKINIAGEEYSTNRTHIILQECQISPAELSALLKEFNNLKYVDLRKTQYSQDECLSLSGELPDVEFVWVNTLFGENIASNVIELDISGTPLEYTAYVEENLKYFPKLEKVIMSDCGISDEEMDALNNRYDDIRFVWTVYFSIYALRTDAIYFCASDVPKRGYVAPELGDKQIEPIKYCTDLEALDLGHMRFTDLSFLSGMTKMKYLILVQGHFSDISVIGTMPDLIYLELFNNNQIVDVSPLVNCKKLKNLNLGYCYFLDWEPFKQMTQLERLWLPHVGVTKAGKAELTEALPNTQLYWPLTDSKGSTGGGWREHQSYYDMRDALHMFYMPGGTGM